MDLEELSEERRKEARAREVSYDSGIAFEVSTDRDASVILNHSLDSEDDFLTDIRRR